MYEGRIYSNQRINEPNYSRFQQMINCPSDAEMIKATRKLERAYMTKMTAADLGLDAVAGMWLERSEQQWFDWKFRDRPDAPYSFWLGKDHG